ncbi:putative FAD-linked oxidoreductase [Colletotrichum tanaceti]|uniref:Putative FAD-linked oxidoreductase n=1 Tax=Colletotrichum tanaceti TaxID=1306861 RepID=A0A4U6X5T6_9PEZI|nr:putative FAD-linked oxidoreductase [Colletotrichum tanaceti]TKW50424.1 putative FAD-linked oxidoreductase [Colletotrichum tanaceti]
MVHLSVLAAASAAVLARGILASPSPVTTQPVGLVPREWQGQQYGCKCYFGDDCWPKAGAWGQLNSTVEGNLHVHVPPEAVCHNSFDGILGSVSSTYDAAKCAEVTANWTDEQWTTDQLALNLWKYFSNTTCLTTEDPSQPCTLGNYGVYVIRATTKQHIKAGVDFARVNNIRLVIRNTGHDFIGRSTGWGALVINTHALQDIAFADSWAGPGDYTGGAVTIGAGVQGHALLTASNARDPPVVVVTGECPTVGIAGGLVAGGGHGPLTTLHGLTADNALEFEAVTADGEFVRANAAENADLFFGLKGGGPSTYAVVTSVTFRTYVEEKAAGGVLYINGTHTDDPALFWESVRIFHKWSNHFVDNGLYAYYELFNLDFKVRPFVAVGKTQAELDDILRPMLDELRAAGVSFDSWTKAYDTFHHLYTDLFRAKSAGLHVANGGWTFSHADVDKRNDQIVDAFRTVVSPREDLQGSGFIIGHLWNAGHGWPESNSATHPVFRNATDFVISFLPIPYGASLETKADLWGVLTNIQDEALRQAGPEGCAYVNEVTDIQRKNQADPFQPNWQDAFWGPLYPTLFDLRKRWDPQGIFYAIATPGTEGWEEIEYNTRLCKKLQKNNVR